MCQCIGFHMFVVIKSINTCIPIHGYFLGRLLASYHQAKCGISANFAMSMFILLNITLLINMYKTFSVEPGKSSVRTFYEMKTKNTELFRLFHSTGDIITRAKQ